MWRVRKQVRPPSFISVSLGPGQPALGESPFHVSDTHDKAKRLKWCRLDTSPSTDIRRSPVRGGAPLSRALVSSLL